jgi:hypothetical protein
VVWVMIRNNCLVIMPKGRKKGKRQGEDIIKLAERTHRSSDAGVQREISLMLTVLLHNREELDNDLRAGSDQNLTLSRLLGVVDGVERIVEDRCLNHGDG